MKHALPAVWLILGSLLWGCAAGNTPPVWESTPAVAHIVRPHYRITVKALKGNKAFYSSFAVRIENRGTGPLAVDWQASRYLHNGKQGGRFMFAGIEPKAIKEKLPVDVIAPGGALAREIWPINLVGMAPYRDGNVKHGEHGFFRGVIPAGNNVVRLVLRADGGKQIESLMIAIEKRQ